MKEFDDKYNDKNLAETWHKLSTHFQREPVKQESSLKSGAGKEDIYESDWPFFPPYSLLNTKQNQRRAFPTPLTMLHP